MLITRGLGKYGTGNGTGETIYVPVTKPSLVLEPSGELELYSNSLSPNTVLEASLELKPTMASVSYNSTLYSDELVPKLKPF